ncbi:O-linked N-acetylglucosamine transferase, SPINDLY family protein [Frateuria aurantia]
MDGSVAGRDPPRGFVDGEWQVVRSALPAAFEITAAEPSVHFPAGHFDAACLTGIEQLPAVELSVLLAHVRRMLRADGYLIVACPDLQAIAEPLAQGRLTEPLYWSGGRAVHALELLYGPAATVGAAIRPRHHCNGFDAAALNGALAAAGFAGTLVIRHRPHYALWGLASLETRSETEIAGLAQAHFPAGAFLLALAPDQRQAWLDLRFGEGLRLLAAGDPAPALAYFEAALAGLEDDAPARAYVLGFQAQLQNSLGRSAVALQLCSEALSLDAASLSAQCARAYAFLLQQEFQHCLDSCEQGLGFHPDRIELLHNRTAALAGLMRNEEALATSERILAQVPGDARALANSAVMLDRLGRHVQALDYYRRAAERNPREPWLLGAWLSARLRVFDWNGLDGLLAQIAHGVDEGRPVVEPFRLLPVSDDARLQLEVARIYVARRAGGILASSQPPTGRPPHGRLRLGYFSSDLRSHPVMELLAEVFELHDRERFEIHAFSFLDDPGDPAQQRARLAFEHFHNVEGMSPVEVVALARGLQLDIAIDLNGHTLGARPAVMAARVAPVQMAFLGYPASTGASYIDYILADPVLIPPSHRAFYTEKVIALPVSFQPSDRRRVRAAGRTERQRWGLPEHGMVYACFNTPMKLQPVMFDCWAEILLAVEGSVLWLYAGQDETTRMHLRQAALARGLDPARIVIAPRVPLSEHLARHDGADLFLDTYPFNAGATASCALWCGLPVLTVTGDTFASRYGASLLTAAGLPELIMPDLPAYRARAIELGRDPEQLASWRHHLQRMAAESSGLFDTPRFVRHLEMACQMAIQRFRAGLPPDHFDVLAAAMMP